MLGPRGLDLGGELSLSASAAVMAACDAVLTIDGGLLHAALATTLPVVALYGPTEIFSTDPRGCAGALRGPIGLPAMPVRMSAAPGDKGAAGLPGAVAMPGLDCP